MAAFQVGRFFDGGATDIGFATSADGGATWGTPGFLPGHDVQRRRRVPFERVSDPSVAFDAAHATWLISSIPILPSLCVPTVFVNRSTDGGRTWSPPVTIPPPVAKVVNLDKNWTVCDNTARARSTATATRSSTTSATAIVELMSTSTDGGRRGATPIQTAGHDKGLGGQPVVQPNGRSSCRSRA